MTTQPHNQSAAREAGQYTQSYSALQEALDDTARKLAEAEATIATLLAACKRATPWLGKLIADGGHLNSVAPNDAIGALQQIEAAQAEGRAE